MLLTRLVLNTGRIMLLDLPSVSYDVADRLRLLILTEGGEVPGMPGWHLRFVFPFGSNRNRSDGSAYFQIADEPGGSRRPVFMAVVAWRRDISLSVWRQVVDGYRGFKDTLVPMQIWQEPPDEPPPLPWVVVWATPFVVLADAVDLEAFGDLIHWVSWTLISP